MPLKRFSLTDLAKHGTGELKNLITNWIRNSGTLLFLDALETMHNPDFKSEYRQQNYHHAVKIYRRNPPIDIISKSGRNNGGTWAHSDIALQFCYWLSPPFQVYLSKEFQRLKKEEFAAKNLEWHIERLTDLVDEARNWLDTVPGQQPTRNRLLSSSITKDLPKNL